jgi:hypothetical protein
LGLLYPLFLTLARCTDFSSLLACGGRVFPQYAVTSWLIILIGYVPLLLAAPYLGAYFCNLAQRRIRFSILELTKSDPRKPILFLRAFKDDRVRLGQARLNWGARIGKWLDHISDLDRMLLEEGTPYGPVVAIGRPGDELPPYVVARGYFDDDAWRSGVLELAETSIAIVICISDTEGIWWEVEHVAARYPDKTLVLLHPGNRSEADNLYVLQRLAGIMGDSIPALRVLPGDVSNGAGNPSPTLGFYTDQEGELNVGRSSTFSRVAYLIMVRLFFRKKWGLAG